MIEVRVLSENGSAEFAEFIQGLQMDPSTPRPDLNVETLSRTFVPLIEIDELRVFETRMDMGRYLTDLFEEAEVNRSDILGNEGLWTWLSYIWLDQLAPLQNGVRRLRENARYLCSTHYTDYFRHYVAGAYDIYSRHGRELSRLFLQCPVDIVNDHVEVFACRQNIISSGQLLEVIHKLYWNDSTGKPKAGTVGRKRPGHIRRFEKVIRQLELTYDIYSMDPDKILSILPSEFDNWK